MDQKNFRKYYRRNEMEKMRKILVVDDLELNQQTLIHLLKDEYEIMIANNGKQAISLLSRYQTEISLVLLDIMMPILNGYDVLKEIKKIDVLSKIPIIVMTQMNDSNVELEALSLGAADFITRPFIPEIVKQRIRNMIYMNEVSAMVDIVTKDNLTGIYNKDTFYRKASDLLWKDTETSYDLIALDIEHFKMINDTYGIWEGDKLLRYIAERLEKLSTEKKAICARVNGDQFMILQPRSKENAEYLVEYLEEEMENYPLDMKVSIKLGFYEIEDLKVPIVVMCDRASLAAAEAKGKYDQIYSYYDDSIRKRLLVEQQITSEMKKALEEGQFQMYLQPKYDLQTNQIAGAEALVRWIHPERGMMSPADFIPLFEKNGFITEMDNDIWQQACDFISRRLDNGKSCVPISVNLSRRDIYKTNLIESLTFMMEHHNFPPEYLHLEITETAYTENPEQLIDVIEKLKDFGCIIEMDDFGSGYSSLNMLSALPIDILKLDMKFMQNDSEKKSGDKSNIIYFIINLAKSMNLSVVAEGVETPEQVEMLKGMGCDFAQGYYYAKPMTVEEFEKLLDQVTIQEN